MSNLKRALDLIRSQGQELSDSGIDNPLREAELLLCGAGSLDRNIIFRDNPFIPQEIENRFLSFVQRRINGEPIQYILGNVNFCDLTIHVGPGVLIPRPETEFLVLKAIEIIKNCFNNTKTVHILEIGTGSGCIAVAVARQCSQAKIYGVDSSLSALHYAQKNALFNQTDNASFISGSLFEPFCGIKFHMVLSNPPYIKSSEINTLQREIRDWEPREALDGGDDGLMFYRQILSQAPQYIFPDGYILLEVGLGQSQPVCHIAETHGFISEGVIADYGGIERVVLFRYKNEYRL